MKQFRKMNAYTSDILINNNGVLNSAVVFTSYNCDILIKAGGVYIPLYNHDASATTSKQATIYTGVNTATRRKQYNYLMKHCANFAKVNEKAREAGRNFNLLQTYGNDASILYKAIREAVDALKDANI